MRDAKRLDLRGSIRTLGDTDLWSAEVRGIWLRTGREGLICCNDSGLDAVECAQWLKDQMREIDASGDWAELLARKRD